MTRWVLFTVADADRTANALPVAGRLLARGLGNFVDPGTADAAERIAASITGHLDCAAQVRVPAPLYADSGGRAG